MLENIDLEDLLHFRYKCLFVKLSNDKLKWAFGFHIPAGKSPR